MQGFAVMEGHPLANLEFPRCRRRVLPRHGQTRHSTAVGAVGDRVEGELEEPAARMRRVAKRIGELARHARGCDRHFRSAGAADRDHRRCRERHQNAKQVFFHYPSSPKVTVEIAHTIGGTSARQRKDLRSAQMSGPLATGGRANRGCGASAPFAACHRNRLANWAARNRS